MFLGDFIFDGTLLCNQLFLHTWIFFCCLFVRYFVFCVVVLWALHTSERVFSPSGVFYFTLLPHIWYKHHYNLLLSRFLWELAVLPWMLQGLPLWLEIQTRPICLFVSHSVQEKILLVRFYLACYVQPWSFLYNSRWFCNPLPKSSIYCQSHVVSIRQQ